MAQEKGIQLFNRTHETQIWALLNASCLERVIYHLIHNAVKFTHHGQINVEVRRVSQSVEIFVRDTGIGIDASFLPLLYEPFKQESAGNNRNFEGSGLGLTVVKKMVEFMDGSISVESNPGIGSTFTVRLPVAISPP